MCVQVRELNLSSRPRREERRRQREMERLQRDLVRLVKEENKDLHLMKETGFLEQGTDFLKERKIHHGKYC